MTGEPSQTSSPWARLVSLARQDVRRLTSTGVPHLLAALMLTQGIGMIRRILLARILTLDELGRMTYVIQIADFVALAADFGICTAVLKFAAEPVDEGEKRRIYVSGLFWGGVISTVVAVLYFLSTLIVSQNEVQSFRIFLLLVTPYIALSAVVKTPILFMQARKEIKRAARFTAITQGANLVLLVCATYIFRLWGFFSMLTLAPLANLVLLLLATRQEVVGISPVWLWGRKLVTFGVPSMLANAVGLANAAAAVVLLRNLTRSHELVGLYSISLLVMMGFRMLPSAIMGTAFPYLSALLQCPECLGKRVRELALKQAAIMTLVSGSWLLIGRFTIVMVFGQRFREAFWPSQILIVGLIAYGVLAPHGQTMLVLGRVGLNMSVSLFQLLCSVLVSLVLIPRYQIAGAAAGMTFGQFAGASASVVLSRAAFQRHYGDLRGRPEERRNPSQGTTGGGDEG
ncbi:MAG: oligosaccharide flippase family protein [Armatimonadetes bacterium]|nr:oligosaccharide flippase family protein [Armatimonadota bacterium]